MAYKNRDDAREFARHVRNRIGDNLRDGYGRSPGPWKANAISNGRIVGDASSVTGEKYQINNHNATVATVYRPADAGLVAAAPDLIAALVRMLAAHDADAEAGSLTAIGNSAAADQARAAIAKATGN